MEQVHARRNLRRPSANNAILSVLGDFMDLC
jgi:hypothetical protein